jgi:glycosyltransferase involved in cell wall biosynthesis
MSLKILFFSHAFYPAIGGIETISEILAHSFYKQGHEVHLLTWTKETGEKTFPFTVIRNPGVLELFRENIWADVVFENNPCFRLGWPGLIFKRPTMIGLQTWLNQIEGPPDFSERLKLKWLGRAKKVIACSEAIRKGIFPQAIVIGNPYDENLFKVSPGVEKKRDFVFLGRLVSDKGADLAIRSFHRVIIERNQTTQKSVNLSLTIIGEGPDKKQLQNTILQLGLENNITLVGALRGKELVDMLNQHRFLLVPSLWREPFGIVALEGMACGCVPIVADGGGLPDAVGDAGIVFKRGDELHLAKCMHQVLEDHELVESLKKVSSTQLLEHSSYKVAEKYLKVLENIFN